MSEGRMADEPEGAAGDHPPPAARVSDLALHYGKTLALAGIDLEIPTGRMVALIGPDGVGKSSLLSLIAGARAIQAGTLGERARSKPPSPARRV